MCLLYFSAQCVTSFTLRNIRVTLYLSDVSLLSHCAIQQFHYIYLNCHFYHTVQYIRTITLMQFSLPLHCEIYQNYYTYAMCHFYYTLQCISYTLILLMQYVTYMLRCSVSLPLHSPTHNFFYSYVRNHQYVRCKMRRFHFMKCSEDTIPMCAP